MDIFRRSRWRFLKRYVCADDPRSAQSIRRLIGMNLCFVYQQEDHTVLNVTQTGVPSNEYDTTLKNWKGYYIQSIKQTFGYGTFLM